MILRLPFAYLALPCLLLALIFSEASGVHASSAVGFTSYGYFNPVLLGKSPGLATLQLKTSANKLATESSSGYRLDLEFVGSTYLGNSEASYWVEANELAWMFPSMGNSQLSVGRRLIHWSTMDESWGLGLWTARNRWDYLRVSPVGLAGVFFETHGEANASLPWELTVAGSPFFIPERGPTLSIRDGVFYPSNAWPGSPPRQIPLSNGIKTDVHYSVAMPPLSKILINPSVETKIRVGARDDGKSVGTWASAGYAYQPVNQVALAFDGYFQHDEDRADATIYPRIAYHQLGEVAVGHQTKKAQVSASLLREVNSLEQAPESWTAQMLPASTYLGSNAALMLGAWRTEVAYLKRFGAPASDQGPQATSGKSAFEPRVMFDHAMSAGLSTPDRALFINGLRAKTKLTYAFETSGTLLSTGLEYQAAQSWVVGLGADLLSSDTPSADSPRDFITKYRAHDRIYGGLNYVF